MTDTGPAVEKQIFALADGRGSPRWVGVRLFDDMKLRMATGAILTLGMPKADDLPLVPAESPSFTSSGTPSGTTAPNSRNSPSRCTLAKEWATLRGTSINHTVVMAGIKRTKALLSILDVEGT
jgi:hypothetical protein